MPALANRDYASGADLKPCPKCGADADWMYSAYQGDVGSTWAECLGCGHQSESVRGHDELAAGKIWNRK